MPLLDVNDAFDPQFMDSFTVLRQYETVNDKGRVVLSVKSMTVTGVITAASPNDLAFVPEYQHMNKAISIYTPYPLQGVTDTTVADTILWHGSEFTINFLEDYTGYGRGFVHAVAISITTPQPPPIPFQMGTA